MQLVTIWSTLVPFVIVGMGVGGENLIRAFVGCWMIVFDTHSWQRSVGRPRRFAWIRRRFFSQHTLMALMWQVRAKAVVVRRHAGIDDAGRRVLAPQQPDLGLATQPLDASVSYRRVIDVGASNGSNRSTH